MKLLTYFGVVFFAIVLGIGGVAKTYLSSESVKHSIQHYLISALDGIETQDLVVHFDAIEWGGILHPFSLSVPRFQLQDSERKVIASDLILGVSARHLLIGKTQLKHIAVRYFKAECHDKTVMSGEFELLLDLPKIAIKVNKIDVSFPDLADFHPMFSQLKGINCPASLVVTANYDGREIVRGLIQGTIGAGDIVLPPYYLQKTPIEHAKFEVNIKPSKITLSQLTLRTKDAFAQLTGSIKGKSILTDFQGGQDLSIILQGSLDRLPVDLIDVYWPHGLARDARQWVTTNLSKGEATNATIQMKAILKGGDDPHLMIEHLSGDIDATDVDVGYLGNLPKVVKTSGHCRYTQSNFIIDAHGTCDGMAVKDAHLDISQLDREHGHMDIDLKVDGSVKSALNLISQKPLELTQKLGLDPELFDGQAETHLKLSFPLDDDSGLDMVQVDSASTIKNASMTHEKFGKIMTAGELSLTTTNDHLNLKGVALVLDHPSDIQASKSFKTNDRMLHIQGKDTRHSPYFGAFDVSLINGKLTGHVDLSKVAYDIPMALFIKESKEPGRFDFSGIHHDSGVVLDAWQLKFGAGMAHGTAHLGSGESHDIKIQSLTLGEIQGRGTVKVKNNHIAVVGTVDVLDLDHIYHHHHSDDEPLSYSVDADLNIGHLKLGHKMNFGQVSLRLTQSKGDLTSLKLISKKPELLEVFVTPEKGDTKHIMLSCHNAGDVLDYFMPNSDFEGGVLNLVGQLSGQPGHRVFKAEIDLRDFVAVKAPVLAQILSLSSLDGIVRTLTGQGVSFSNTVGHLEWSNDKLILKDIHAAGSSIALTLDGSVDLVTDNLVIDGELYPLNSLNTMLASIPLVGHVLGGDKNRGVFATAFKLSGKRQDPVISANPLSTIAPQGVKELYKQQVSQPE